MLHYQYDGILIKNANFHNYLHRCATEHIYTTRNNIGTLPITQLIVIVLHCLCIHNVRKCVRPTACKAHLLEVKHKFNFRKYIQTRIQKIDILYSLVTLCPYFSRALYVQNVWYKPCIAIYFRVCSAMSKAGNQRPIYSGDFSTLTLHHVYMCKCYLDCC